MINLHKRYVANLGLKHVTPGSAVRHASDFIIMIMELGLGSYKRIHYKKLAVET